MRYRALGTSGMLVSEIALGTATFGEIADRDDAERIVAVALDRGINFFDTADVYVGGRSEEIIGRALKPHRDRVILATKVGARVGDDEVALAASHRIGGLDHAARWTRGIAPTDQGLSRKHLTAALESSLRRLDTDYIDLYTLHRFDPHTSIENVLDTLTSFVAAGKVRAVACSGWAAWRLTRALSIAELRRTVRLEATQLPYNLLLRGQKPEIISACAEQNVGLLAFQVLAGGMLTGRHSLSVEPQAGSRLGSRESYRSRYWNASTDSAVHALVAHANVVGRTPAELAIGWVLAHPPITSVLFGASQPTQLDDAWRATECPLTQSEVSALETALDNCTIDHQGSGT